MSAVPHSFIDKGKGEKMAILDSVKASQRVINTKVDTDYTELIEACKNELLRLGIADDKVYSDNDTEVTQACKLYVHWMTDYEGKGAQWGQMYVNYTNSLALHCSYLEDCEV